MVGCGARVWAGSLEKICILAAALACCCQRYETIYCNSIVDAFPNNTIASNCSIYIKIVYRLSYCNILRTTSSSTPTVFLLEIGARRAAVVVPRGYVAGWVLGAGCCTVPRTTTMGVAAAGIKFSRVAPIFKKKSFGRRLSTIVPHLIEASDPTYCSDRKTNAHNLYTYHIFI